MALRILINGARGKMGQATVNALTPLPEFFIVGQTGHADNLAEEIKKSTPDLVIDFTHADAVFKNTQIIIDAGVHPVIGSTGLLSEQIEKLQTQCARQQLGGIIAPNFSIAAVLMMKYAEDAVTYFPDVEIIEMHHHGKADSPSGTALKTADRLKGTRIPSASLSPAARELLPGARGAISHDIHIHSIRLPGLVAHQRVIFGGIGETLTIQHDTTDRQCFMPGVILACQKVSGLKKLVYGLENIL